MLMIMENDFFEAFDRVDKIDSTAGEHGETIQVIETYCCALKAYPMDTLSGTRIENT